MEQPAIVRKLGIEVVADAATRAQFIECNLANTREELRFKYLINATSVLQDMAFRLLPLRVTALLAAVVLAGCGQRRVWVYRAAVAGV